MPDNKSITRKIELVETANLAASLHRLRNSAPHDGCRWKRALIHALNMEVYDTNELKAVREALGQP